LRYYLSTFMGTFTASTANDLMTRHAYNSDEEWNRAVERIMQSRGALHVRTERSGLPATTRQATGFPSRVLAKNRQHIL
jgi:hypothetical protein